MYCLIQLYVPISGYLKEHKPLLKLFAVKAVGRSFLLSEFGFDLTLLTFALVFLTFWQATGLSLLSMTGIVKNVRWVARHRVKAN